ncbi:MAG: hypothetical protein Nk1A_4470 [Endomicrobiia bacterium]|nr:MAG: hypothetical protein Nk1A_4470 [Endomicrobiia bacterium]
MILIITNVVLPILVIPLIAYNLFDINILYPPKLEASSSSPDSNTDKIKSIDLRFISSIQESKKSFVVSGSSSHALKVLSLNKSFLLLFIILSISFLNSLKHLPLTTIDTENI